MPNCAIYLPLFNFAAWTRKYFHSIFGFVYLTNLSFPAILIIRTVKEVTMKRRRFLSLFIAALYLLSLIFSVSFLATQSNHEHISEESCVICVEIQSCTRRLHVPAAESKNSNSETVAVDLSPCAKGRVTLPRNKKRSTPVSLKVKLSN